MIFLGGSRIDSGNEGSGIVRKRDRVNVVGKSIGREENKHNSKKNDRIMEGKDSVKRSERRSGGERKETMGPSSPPPNAGSAQPPYRGRPKVQNFRRAHAPVPGLLQGLFIRALGERERERETLGRLTLQAY